MQSTPWLLPLLQACSSLRELKQIHAHAITHGLARFAFVSSRILSFCAQYRRGDLRYARSLFSQIHAPSVFDFNSMISGFSTNSQSHESFSFYNLMLSVGIRPNSRTFTSLVRASCVSLSLLEQVHAGAIKLGNISDVYMVSSVILAYSKHGAVHVARQVFDESPHRNVVCWTSLITGYCKNGLVSLARELFDAIPERNDVCNSAMVSGYVRNGFFREAIDLFRELKSRLDDKLNGSLLASVLNACAAAGAFKEGRCIHCYVDKNGFVYELELGTALMDFYAKCGWVRDAEEIFKSMPSKDVATWSAMISGLATNGKSQEALDLFAKMEKVGLKPNAVTFIGVLTACNHKHHWSRVQPLFERMIEKYGIMPSIEHYGIMVDILARGGRMEEALSFISSMPMEPDGAIWGSLVNGCLIHGHVELGQRVGKYLIELEPQHSGRYVLLANLYASFGKWECVSKMRKLMKERGVPATSAWSSIEIDQSIHKFVVDDKSCSIQKKSVNVLRHLGKGLENFVQSRE